MKEYRGAALQLLWWATVVELILVRVVSRVGVFIPKGGTALAVYRAAVGIGEVAFSFSIFMGVILLGLTLAGHRWWVAVPGALAGALAMFIPGPVPPPAWSLLVALTLTASLVMLGAAALRATADRWELAALSAVLTVHLLGYAVAAGQLAWAVFAQPGSAPLAGAALRAGELLAVMAPVLLAVPLLRNGRLTHGAIGLGSAAALGAAYLANADITAILAMYSLGFTMSWPAWLYLAALGLGVAGLLAAMERDRTRGLALGLLFLAGYTPGINQQHLLVLAGWALLALPLAAAPAPVKEVSPA